DELTSLRSANFLVETIGGARARMVVLEDSYHMVCVDNDREIVAKNVLEFFGAALPGATSALANDPRMSATELRSAVDNLLSRLAAADYDAVRALGIPDFTWVQPGDNKIAGAHVGKAFASLAGRLPAPGSPRPAGRGAGRQDARVTGFVAGRLARGKAARASMVRRRGRARGRLLRTPR